MDNWTIQGVKGFIEEHKNSRSSYYETKAKDIECLLNEHNALLDRVLEIIDKASDENRNHVGVVQNDDMDKAYSIIWERVCDLKGDGYESSD